MQSHTAHVRGASLAILVSLLVGGCASSRGLPSTAPPEPWGTAELAARVESAHSAEDHASIARDYDRLSASALAESAGHRRLVSAYSSRYKGTTGESLAAHCAQLANQHEAMAELYATMAAEHRDVGSHVGH